VIFTAVKTPLVIHLHGTSFFTDCLTGMGNWWIIQQIPHGQTPYATRHTNSYPRCLFYLSCHIQNFGNSQWKMLFFRILC